MCECMSLYQSFNWSGQEDSFTYLLYDFTFATNKVVAQEETDYFEFFEGVSLRRGMNM